MSAGSSGARSTAGAGGPVEEALVGHRHHRPVEAAGRDRSSRLRSSAITTPRLDRLDPRAQVARPQLLGARQRHRPDPEAGDHARRPTRAGSRSASSPRRRGPRRAAASAPASRAERSATSPKPISDALAAAVEGHQRPRPGRSAASTTSTGEIHRASVWKRDSRFRSANTGETCHAAAMLACGPRRIRESGAGEPVVGANLPFRGRRELFQR